MQLLILLFAVFPVILSLNSNVHGIESKIGKPNVLEMLKLLSMEEGGQYTSFSKVLIQVPRLQGLFSGLEKFEDKEPNSEERDDSFGMIVFMPTNEAVSNRGNLESAIFKNAILYHIVRTKQSRKSLNQAAEKGYPIVLETALSSANSGTGNSFAVRLPPGISQHVILNSPRAIPAEFSDVISLKPNSWSVQYGLLPEATILSPEGWECSNGLILPIDVFLLPPVDFVVTMSSLHVAGFVRLLSSAGIGNDLPPGTLIGKPGITLFLPTQEALMEKINFLQELGKKELDALLKRHIIIGDKSQPVYLNGKTQIVKAASGETVLIEPSMYTDSEAGIVNGQRILYGNVLLSNGVAHIIDGLLPATTPHIENTLNETKNDTEDEKEDNSINDSSAEVAGSLSAVWTGSSAFMFAGALLGIIFIL